MGRSAYIRTVFTLQLFLPSHRVDFTTSNLNNENLNKLSSDKIPDVVSIYKKVSLTVFF